MADLQSIKVWESTLKDIARLGVELAKERNLPRGKRLSKAEIVHHAVRLAMLHK